jgi:hypothetical protein
VVDRHAEAAAVGVIASGPLHRIMSLGRYAVSDELTLYFRENIGLFFAKLP